ncbi:hypothetical protein RLPCCGM1_p0965 [Rhizobium leguminosarum bv. phaseoli CCGM1]|uniref:Uncharacterized protein n=1 Tax=Rhizobium phaseoli TaxID=396 RepID=A0ABM6CK55_9HYPH|nr:hypothetical protein AMC81_PE00456 [Rhizobium phaseoli]ANL95211.1 hypothetical protein AMC80_PE00456 [Rhizobium phaseoli]KEC70174.1 hypothetical protein RLPCCGM1_p0965 [Rhizobium leguminosarum bv. phaseoli CCGM1]
MTFPRPKAEAPAQRFEEASAAARDALEKLIAAANEPDGAPRKYRSHSLRPRGF